MTCRELGSKIEETKRQVSMKHPKIIQNIKK